MTRLASGAPLRHVLLVAVMCAGCGGSTGQDGAAPADAQVPSDAAVPPDAASSADLATGGDGGAAPLPLGTVQAQPGGCPDMGVFANSTCMRLAVDCTNATGAPSIGATAAVTEPQGAVVGTVVQLNGGPGTMPVGPVAAYLKAGLRNVTIWFDSTWEHTPDQGTLAAACRPATAIRWAFDNPHAGSRTAGFCAEGASAGSGAIAYSLAHYGLSDTLDYAHFISGPPFGRIDVGCDPASYAGPARDVCKGLAGELDPAPFNYQGNADMGPIALVNSGENTTTCGTPNPPVKDVQRWAADSVVSPGAVYDYPNTPLKFFYCTSASTNEVTGLGSFYFDAITSQHDEACYTQCAGEMVQMDPAGKMDVEQSMIAGCVPHH